ncbi:MAG: kelch repeat-containing protein [Aliidongia sp.]
MATSRAQNTQTLLPNGKVLVTGGSNLQAPYGDEMLVPINESEVYDPASNIWSSAGAMSTARALHTATLLNNGKVLVVGGTTDGSTITDNVDIYDPSTNSWAPAAPLNTARQQHTATLLSDGRVLVAGGVPTVYTPLASAEIYDPVANTWTNVASMNDARSQHAAILLPSGHVLVATGYGGNAFLSSAELYDPGSNTWTRTGSLDVEARGAGGDAPAKRQGPPVGWPRRECRRTDHHRNLRSFDGELDRRRRGHSRAGA